MPLTIRGLQANPILSEPLSIHLSNGDVTHAQPTLYSIRLLNEHGGCAKFSKSQIVKHCEGLWVILSPLIKITAN